MTSPRPDLAALRELHQTGQFEAAKAGYLALLKHHPNDAGRTACSWHSLCATR